MLQNETLIDIIKSGKQYEAIQMLLHSLNKEKVVAVEENEELYATISLIKKINKGKNKDIDNLCNGDKELQEYRKKSLRSLK